MFLKILIVSSTSQSFLSNVSIALWILYLFCFPSTGVTPQSNIPLSLSGFYMPHLYVYVGCWSFLDLKCPWFSLVCPIRSLLKLNRILPTTVVLSYFIMRGLMWFSLLVLFSHSDYILILNHSDISLF